eukprot:1194423-Prorocentrum_minimum.AAC.8
MVTSRARVVNPTRVVSARTHPRAFVSAPTCSAASPAKKKGLKGKLSGFMSKKKELEPTALSSLGMNRHVPPNKRAGFSPYHFKPPIVFHGNISFSLALRPAATARAQ